jgi:hypothetical protein
MGHRDGSQECWHRWGSKRLKTHPGGEAEASALKGGKSRAGVSKGGKDVLVRCRSQRSLPLIPGATKDH